MLCIVNGVVISSDGKIDLQGANNSLGNLYVWRTNGYDVKVQNRGSLMIGQIDAPTSNVTINNTGATMIAAGYGNSPAITANSFTLNNTDGAVTLQTRSVSIGGDLVNVIYFATKEATINLLGTSTFQTPTDFVLLNNATISAAEPYNYGLSVYHADPSKSSNDLGFDSMGY